MQVCTQLVQLTCMLTSLLILCLAFVSGVCLILLLQN
jgi:hypothetical protein